MSTVARGNSRVRNASSASSASSCVPLIDAATGSTTNGVDPSAPIPTRSHASAIAVMISAVASIPVFTASRPMSVATASICAATVSGGSTCTPVTATEFCTVTAVTATQPCTPHAASARRSDATPAPPPESVPAIVITRGGVAPTARSAMEATVDRGTSDNARAVVPTMPLTGEHVTSKHADWAQNQIDKIVEAGTTEVADIKGMAVVLITYRGRKTGNLRKLPLMRVEHDGVYAAVASKGGAPQHPGWYTSIRDEPHVELQDGTVTSDYIAREVDRRGARRSGGSGRSPPTRAYAEYQVKTDRLIPVFVLEPTG